MKIRSRSLASGLSRGEEVKESKVINDRKYGNRVLRLFKQLKLLVVKNKHKGDEW